MSASLIVSPNFQDSKWDPHIINNADGPCSAVQLQYKSLSDEHAHQSGGKENLA
jgi:hypothetical protein